MQSPFENSESRKRFLTISAFIQDLRLAKSWSLLEPSVLQQAATVWDATLSNIDYGYMTERGEGSLFWMASRMGYTEAEKVLDLFNAHQGGRNRVDAEMQAYREREAGYAAQEIPVGPNRHRMQEILAANGWPEERLLRFAELR